MKNILRCLLCRIPLLDAAGQPRYESGQPVYCAHGRTRSCCLACLSRPRDPLHDESLCPDCQSSEAAADDFLEREDDLIRSISRARWMPAIYRREPRASA